MELVRFPVMTTRGILPNGFKLQNYFKELLKVLHFVKRNFMIFYNLSHNPKVYQTIKFGKA